jgi:hypothetical protein
MMIMPANNTSCLIGYLAGKYPNRIGMLNSPFYWKNPPFFMPHACDNGVFTSWNPRLFRFMLKRAKLLSTSPLWVVVPDVVGDAEATLKLWHEWHKQIPFKLAFACQDGCEPQDVPKNAECCFIGGTTDWKLSDAHKFKGVAKLLHIGRVTTGKRLRWAEDIGADSVDGSGFFRGSINSKQAQDFIEYFEGSTQGKLF